MTHSMYPFWAAILAAAIAQLLKPVTYYFKDHHWSMRHCQDAGGMPSSHSAMVTAMALSVGFRDGFSSALFAVSFTMACIVIYDAANVRYYSGQNIKLTQQLVKDVQEMTHMQLQNPIYNIKLKEVLGHKWAEVLGGMLVGALIASIFHFCF